MANWKHRKKRKTDQTGNSTNIQFFSNEIVGNFSNALVRESIQNTLDEMKDESKPVMVRIFLSGEKYALSPEEFRPYLQDLRPHLEAEGNGIHSSELPDFSKPVPFIVFEDFNTKGLEGDPLEFEYDKTRDKTKPHNFYFFWRAYGMSGKLGGKMGSWGIGKSVFPAASRINCYLAMTVRESDKKAYLIGQSVLKTHNLVAEPAECGYEPYGNYANFDNEDFSLPEDSPQEIAKVSKLFGLSRSFEQGKNRSSNTGLSIIVPYPRKEITTHNLILSTIEQFFYPIILGKLVVEFFNEDTSTVLNSSSLNKVLLQLGQFDDGTNVYELKDRLLSLFKFTEWVNSVTPDKQIELAFDKVDRAFEWRKDELFKNVDLNHLRQIFDTGTPLAFKVPLKYQPEGAKPELRHFLAFLQKDSALQDPENYFIRGYLNIIGIKSLKRKGVRGMVIISDQELVTFFGQAEGPAHTGWHKDNFRTKYENIEECLSFVQRSLDRLFQILLMPSEGLDKGLLQDFFSIPEPENESSKGNANKTGMKKTPTDFPPPQPVIRPYVASKIDGGFRISGNKEHPFQMEEITVRMAYDRFDGNPFSSYSEFDFDTRRLQIASTRVVNLKIERNELKFEAEDNDFELKVTGFDPKRDLIVDMKP